MKKSVLLISILFIHFISYSQIWEKVKAGGEFSIGIKSDGSMWGWGFNGNGQLGLSTENTYFYIPVQISESKDWIDIAAGGFHTLALKSEGTLWGTGLNAVGEINEGTNTQYETFVQIGTDTDWVALDASEYSSYAIKHDGSLWAWGYNFNAELGVGDTINRNTPTRVGTDNDWKSISCGGLFCLGIKTDKSLWRWGLNIQKDSTTYLYNKMMSPVPILPYNNWKMVSSGYQTIFALNENGTIWGYGSNINFALGDSSVDFSNDFIQITQDSNWQFIEAGASFTFAINDAGELYGWGNNILGQLGFYDGENMIPVPAHIGSDNGWKYISAGKGFILNNGLYGMHTLALKQDSNYLCVAGANYIGQLGLGYTSNTPTTSFTCSVYNTIDNTTLTDEQLNVFPNPANSVIHIENYDGIIRHIDIYDLVGKKIQQSEINNSQASLDISALQTGIYIAQIQTSKGVTNKKFIKQ